MNQGGKFWIGGAVHVTVNARAGATGPSYSQQSGEFYFEGGSAITVQNGITLAGGQFTPLWHGNANNPETVTIVGNFLNKGATIESALNMSYGTILVQGNVTWNSGSYKPRLQTATQVGELWKATGKFTVGLDASLTPQFVGPPPQPLNNWIIITGLQEIVGSPPPVAATFKIESTGGDPVTNWVFVVLQTP